MTGHPSPRVPRTPPGALIRPPLAGFRNPSGVIGIKPRVEALRNPGARNPAAPNGDPTMNPPFPLLTARNLHKTYRKDKIEVPVLTGLELAVWPGEFLCVVGASGSGKSTLLHLLGTLDQPDQGDILLDGERIDNVPPRRRDQLRNGTFGFIFQFYHLLPELTALENVLMPELIGSTVLGWLWRRRDARRRATDLLERVGLGQRLHHRPRE